MQVRDDIPSGFLHKYDPRDGSFAEEALLAGPVNYRWMYPIERLLGDLKKTVRNRAKPEGSIIEAWVQYESLTFCGMYLKDVDTAFNRPQRNNDGGMRNETLSVFAQSARPFGDPVKKLKSSNSPSYSEELYNLAFGPIRAELFSGCHVNGVKFLGTARDDKLCTQNSGVHVPGGGESTDVDLYGKLTTVVQLLYKDRYQVIMFKCRWFDTNPNRQGSVKIDHGLLSVNINRTWYDDDPYILANMARQIVYLDDPKAGSGWKVVQQMDQRNVYAIPELDPTDNDIDNVTDQRLDSSMETDAETLRDTDVIQEPFQLQGVSSIEIPIQSITIDLGDLPRYEVPVGPNNESDEEEDWETENSPSSSLPLSALNTLSLRRHHSPVLRRQKDCAATTSEAQRLRCRHRRRIRRKKLGLAVSAPAVFSLLEQPIPTPEVWSVTTTPSPEPPARSVSAATAPALMVELPGVSQTPASSASSVAQPVSARRRHRPASTTDTTSTDGTVASGSQPAKKNTRGPCRQLKTAKVTRVTNSRISIGYDDRHRAAPTAELHSSLAHDVGHVVRTHCPMRWKSWKVMPDEIKMGVRGQLSDLNEESLAYVNRLFGERYKQWKSDLHHHFQAYDDPEVALREGCPKELEGREDSWAWLCTHFQAPDFVNKTQVNKGNRKKKTLLHHSGSRPFSYRMDARRRGGSKFPEIDVFGDVYVRPGMSWPDPFIRRWWRGASWCFRSLPPNFLPRLRSSL
ncbi:unnamed protein product [Prunus brigantina]